MPSHDPAYKRLFAHADLIADLIRGFVREDWVADLDFGTLERVTECGVSDDLRERDDDILWRLRWGSKYLYVYILLEFQSRVDRFMAVRLLTYIGLLYQNLADAGAIPPGDPLPPVLPLVLYNGEERWWARTSLADLGDPELPEALQRWQPQLRYLLIEERCHAELDLGAWRNLAAALFRLESSRNPADLEAVVACLADWLDAPEQASLRRAFVVWLKQVLVPARLPDAEIANIVELQEMRSMLAERVKRWTEEWERQGMERGMERGMEQGIGLGMQRGEARLLRRQLERRFGPLPDWVETRLAQAGTDVLETWSDQVLDSPSLEAVFAEPH